MEESDELFTKSRRIVAVDASHMKQHFCGGNSLLLTDKEGNIGFALTEEAQSRFNALLSRRAAKRRWGEMGYTQTYL